MAVATVFEVSARLREALDEIEGLRVIEFIPDSLNPPMATVGVDNVLYHGAFGPGNPQYFFTISIVVARASDRIAQKRLDEYLSWDGAASIRAAIEKDPTLCGAVQSCQVVSGGNVTSINVNEVLYLSVEFTVEVYA